MMTTWGTRDAWSQFHEGSSSQGRPEILDSWKRSRRSGVDPSHIDLSRHEIDDQGPLVRAGAPILLGMADLLVGSSTSLALADVSGTVLWRWESESELSRALDRIEFEPGSQVSESAAGTNAIGVANTLLRPALVVGAEHYKEPWHDWACVAAPVIHPILRRPIGSVNIACHARDANHMLLVAARSLVAEVTTALREAASARENRMLDIHLGARAMRAGAVVTIDRHTMIADDEIAEFGMNQEELRTLFFETSHLTSKIDLGGGRIASVRPIVAGDPSEGVVAILRQVRSDQHRDLPRPAKASLGPLERSEIRVITETLRATAGNKTEAATRLGISRGTLYHRLRRYRID